MKPEKISRGTRLPATMWKEIEEMAELLGYNENQFIESCVSSMLEMIKSREKRAIPKLVYLADAAKDCMNIPIHLINDTKKNKLKN